MDVYHAIASRRTIQRFRPGAIPVGALERALAAATWAPNHKTTWPFRFVLPGPASREVIFRTGLRLKAAKRGSSPELEAAVRQDLLAPDRLVAVVQRLAADEHRALEDYAACACAVQNLMLALHAEGVGTKWGTGGTLREPDVHEALGVDPVRERIVAFVWVGVPAVVPLAPARPPLAELVTERP
ncbi:MAG: nitroreductase family protein [Deltaproteobacteria bacterium]|nr:nitroreductase family protein [Deltaproteobacteria bacterium]